MKTITIRLTALMLGCSILSGVLLATPLQYTLSLAYDNTEEHRIVRRLELIVDTKTVGYVSYEASLSEHPSKINVLQVYQDYRASHGYGKILLYSAINDIYMTGNRHIVLHRSPFNLKQGEDWHTRDRQLRAWYERFGFIQNMDGSSIMELSNPSRFLSEEVITSFGKQGVTFSFKDKGHVTPSGTGEQQSRTTSTVQRSHTNRSHR